MRTIIFGLICMCCSISFGQQSEAEKVQLLIETFFEGFHKQDSVMMKQTVAENPILQTIGTNKEGKTMVRTEEFGKLIKSIVSIPPDTKFEEKIKSYKIRVDGPMANAWTPYEFWLNDKFSHCGVNSFQLFNDGNGWKIIYLVDTRRKQDCSE